VHIVIADNADVLGDLMPAARSANISPTADLSLKAMTAEGRLSSAIGQPRHAPKRVQSSADQARHMPATDLSIHALMD
jgi:hypothetical protein